MLFRSPDVFLLGKRRGHARRRVQPPERSDAVGARGPAEPAVVGDVVLRGLQQLEADVAVG